MCVCGESMRKGTIGDKFLFSNNGQNVKSIIYSSIFSFLAHWKIQIFWVHFVQIFVPCKIWLQLEWERVWWKLYYAIELLECSL